MKPEHEAKIQAARERRARELAAIQSQADVLAGRRDAYGNKISKGKPKSPRKSRPSSERAKPITEGTLCKRCERPMATSVKAGFVVHRAHGFCSGCEGRGPEVRSRFVVLDNCEDCGKPMSKLGALASEVKPGEVHRKTYRRCRGCTKGRVVVPRTDRPRNCVECKVVIVSRGTPLGPGERRFGSLGRCKSCYQRLKKATVE